MDRILKFMQKPTKYCKECGKKLDWIGTREYCNKKCLDKFRYKKNKVMTYPNEKI